MSNLYRLTDRQRDAAIAAINLMIASYDPNGDSAGTSMITLERASDALCKPVKASKKASAHNAQGATE